LSKNTYFLFGGWYFLPIELLQIIAKLSIKKIVLNLVVTNSDKDPFWPLMLGLAMTGLKVIFIYALPFYQFSQNTTPVNTGLKGCFS